MSIVIDLTQDEETLVRTVARQEGIDPTSYIANLVHRHLRQQKVQLAEIQLANGHAKTARRIGNLHPGNFRPSADFDAPLPDEFWFGEA
jgi:hypothetical protein